MPIMESLIEHVHSPPEPLGSKPSDHWAILDFQDVLSLNFILC